MADLFVTRIFLSEAVIESVVKELNTALANSETAQNMIKFAHWNVKGETFWQTHKLFDEVFDKVLEITDDIGERIGALGGIAEGLPQHVSANSTMRSYSAESARSTALQHIEAVANVVSELGNGFMAAARECERLGDIGTSDCFTAWAVEAQHKLYFLEAHLRP